VAVGRAGRSGGPPPEDRDRAWLFHWQGLLPLAIVGVLGAMGWRLVAAPDAGDTAAALPEPAVVETAPATTRPVVVVTIAAPTTVAATVAAAPPVPPPTTVPQRVVTATGELKPCRFGASCLVISFAISGFDPHPGRFTCVYPNSRREFPFNGPAVEDACLSGDEGDTIHIEVDGVVSAPVSATNLNP